MKGVFDFLGNLLEIFNRDRFGKGLMILRTSLNLYRDDFRRLTREEVRSLEEGHLNQKNLRLFFEEILEKGTYHD